jgi:hypothetical protein
MRIKAVVLYAIGVSRVLRSSILVRVFIPFYAPFYHCSSFCVSSSVGWRYNRNDGTCSGYKKWQVHIKKAPSPLHPPKTQFRDVPQRFEILLYRNKPGANIGTDSVGISFLSDVGART